MSERSPLVVLSGGGTGGHLYPALAIADGIRALRPDVHVRFIGAERGIEARILPQRGEDHLLLPVHGIDRRRPWQSWRAVTGLVVGLVRVVRSFQRRRPEVVVVTGGYAGASAGIAAGLMGVPLVLQEQNSWPGAVTRLLTRVATRVHVAYPEAIDRLPAAHGRCVVSGNPVRDATDLDRDAARAAFGVPVDVLLAFVTGGSQGSRALNSGMVAWIDGIVRGEIDHPAALHLLWSTGPRHATTVAEALSAAGSPEWVHALPYIEDMPAALAASDFAICRAGAMTAAELLNQGLPSILVPLPTAAEDHQTSNARALEAAGAAVLLPESEMTPGRLAQEIAALVSNPGVLAAMRERALERARPDATRVIASDVSGWLPPARRAA